MTHKHTPGPWISGYTAVQSGDGYDYGGSATLILPDGLVVVFGSERHKEARIASAAPDLLDALKEATMALNGFAIGEGVFKPIEQTIIKARAAIAKAKGENE